MKKLPIVLLGLMIGVCALMGCRRPHVFHTYYGDIDIDTMEIVFYDIKDSLPCYLVFTKEIDSVEKAPGVWGYIYGPLNYYYCPAKDVYYYTAPDNHGREWLRGVNPYTGYYGLPTEF